MRVSDKTDTKTRAETEIHADVPIIGTMTDATGDEIRFGVLGRSVFIGCDSPAILDSDEAHDEFLRLYKLAREQAKANAT
jgi:hypothetical protein